MFIKLVGIGLVFNPRKPSKHSKKNLRDKVLKLWRRQELSLQITDSYHSDGLKYFPWSKVIQVDHKSFCFVNNFFVLLMPGTILKHIISSLFWYTFLQSMPDQLDVPLWVNPLQRSHMSSNRSPLQREDWLRVSSHHQPWIHHPSSLIQSSSIRKIDCG